MIILSILIPTIPKRGEQFKRLYDEVFRQRRELHKTHPTLGSVEIVVGDSPAFLDGGPSIGKKRDNLIRTANGKYFCFLDDDESISPDYLEVLVRLCNEDKDVVTFRNISKMDNFWMTVNMSLEHSENEQARPGEIRRRPWHICPVRATIGRQFKFPWTSYGEDWNWFEQVLNLCETEAHTDAIIHQYNHSSKESEADKIINHGIFTK